jgi:DNA-binding GntR family transcriptional regulator
MQSFSLIWPEHFRKITLPSTAIETDLPTRALGKSLVDRAHDELHRLITDGDLADDERIVIDRFARQFGTSLIPIREALARLHAEGLVIFEPNKGYRVAPRPTVEELVRLFEARLVIEMGAAELALERSTPEALRELKRINRFIAKGSYGTTYEGFREFVTLNEQFHIALVALADNPPLAEAYRRLGYHQKITRPTYGRGPGDVKRFVREHDAIIDALERRDLRALRHAVRRHIASGRERFEVQGNPEDGPATMNGSAVKGGHASRKPPDRSAASRARKKAP